jgi:hypothetical protein
MSASSTDMPRREFMCSVYATGIACLAASSWACFGADTLRAAFAEFFVDRRAAGIVGRVYLHLTPNEGDPEQLVALIAGDSRAVWEALLPDRVALFRELRRKHRDDLKRGDTTLLDGWILSSTEARLYALASIG